MYTNQVAHEIWANTPKRNGEIHQAVQNFTNLFTLCPIGASLQKHHVVDFGISSPFSHKVCMKFPAQKPLSIQ
jgi:hypothetical protein